MKRTIFSPLFQAVVLVLVALTLFAFGQAEAAAGLALAGGATTYSDVFTGLKPRRNTPVGAEILQMVVPFTLPAVAPVVNDIIGLCKVPIGVDIIDWSIQTEDADTNVTPTLEYTLGSLNAGRTDITTAYAATIGTGETGGLVRASTSAAFAESNAAERAIGIKWTTAAATYAASKKGVLVLELAG